MMRVSGQLIEVQHNSGSFVDKATSENVDWENATIRVFDGREVTVLKVKTKEAIATAMTLKGQEGSPVEFDVDSPRQVETRSLVLAD